MVRGDSEADDAVSKPWPSDADVEFDIDSGDDPLQMKRYNTGEQPKINYGISLKGLILPENEEADRSTAERVNEESDRPEQRNRYASATSECCA